MIVGRQVGEMLRHNPDPNANPIQTQETELVPIYESIPVDEDQEVGSQKEPQPPYEAMSVDDDQQDGSQQEAQPPYEEKLGDGTTTTTCQSVPE